jgi:hypothetical protein
MAWTGAVDDWRDLELLRVIARDARQACRVFYRASAVPDVGLSNAETCDPHLAADRTAELVASVSITAGRSGIPCESLIESVWSSSRGHTPKGPE